MVSKVQQLELFVATDDEVNDLTAGKAAGQSYPWPSSGASVRIPKGKMGVLCRQDLNRPGGVRPIALVLHAEDERRLFGRFSQLRGDLSPISSWLHLFTPQHFEKLDGPLVQAELDGMEASWAGLIIAESVVLSGRAPAQLKLTACLATQSFAVGRATALGASKSIAALLDGYDELQKTLRSDKGNYSRLRSSFEPIWAILQAASGVPSKVDRDQEYLVSALLSLRKARDTGAEDNHAIMESLWLVPEAKVLAGYEEEAPERRLQHFDLIVEALRQSRNEPGRRLHLAFLAAYMATIAAGGASSLGIAEAVSDEMPEVLAFAYVIAGVAEYRSWSGAFDGLGRLVARELLRDLNVADGPACDFSSNEALVLIDRQLSDPLVYLRLKQSRIATAALLPGLNIQVPFAEPVEARQSQQSIQTTPLSEPTQDPMRLLADALLPYLTDGLASANKRTTSEGKAQNSKRGARRSY